MVKNKDFEFVYLDGSPMRFALWDRLRNKRQLEILIKKHGGTLVKYSPRPDILTISISSNKSTDIDPNYRHYSCHYIYNCVNTNRILKLKAYAISPASECHLGKNINSITTTSKSKSSSNLNSECADHVSLLKSKTLEQTISTPVPTKDVATFSAKTSKPQKPKDKAKEIEIRTESIENKRKLLTMGNKNSNDKSLHEPVFKKVKPNPKVNAANTYILPTILSIPSRHEGMSRSSDNNSVLTESVNKNTSKNGFIDSHDIVERGELGSATTRLNNSSINKATATVKNNTNNSINEIRNLSKKRARPVESSTISSLTGSEIDSTQDSTQASQDRSIITQVPFDGFSDSTKHNNTRALNEPSAQKDNYSRIVKDKTGSEHAKTSVSSLNPKVPTPSTLQNLMPNLPNKPMPSLDKTKNKTSSSVINSKSPVLPDVATSGYSKVSPVSESFKSGGMNKTNSLLNAENLRASTKTTHSLKANSISSKVFAQASTKNNVSSASLKGLSNSDNDSALFISDTTSQADSIKPSLAFQKSIEVGKPNVQAFLKAPKDKAVQGFSENDNKAKPVLSDLEKKKGLQTLNTKENMDDRPAQNVSKNAQNKPDSVSSKKTNKQSVTIGQNDKSTTSNEAQSGKIISFDSLSPPKSSANTSNLSQIAKKDSDFVLVRTVKKRKQQYFPLLQRKRPFGLEKKQISQTAESNDLDKASNYNDIKEETALSEETGKESDSDIADNYPNDMNRKQASNPVDDSSKNAQLNANNNRILVSENDNNIITSDQSEDDYSESIIIGPTAEPSSSNDTGNETFSTNDKTIMFTQDDDNGTVVDNQKDLCSENSSGSESLSPTITTNTVKVKKDRSKALLRPMVPPKFVAVNDNLQDQAISTSSGMTKKPSIDLTRTSACLAETRTVGKITTKMPSFSSVTPQKTSLAAASKDKLSTKNLSFTTVPKDTESAKNHTFTTVSKNNVIAKTHSFNVPLKTKEKSTSVFLKEKGRSTTHLQSGKKTKPTAALEPEAALSRKSNVAVSSVKNETSLSDTKGFGNLKPMQKHSQNRGADHIKQKGKKHSTLGFSLNSTVRPSHLPPKPIRPPDAPVTKITDIDIKITKPTENNSLFVESEISKKSKSDKNVSYLRKGLLSSSSQPNAEVDSLKVKTSKLTTVVNDTFPKADKGNSWTSPIVIDEASNETINSSFNISSTENVKDMELFSSQVKKMTDKYKQPVSHVLNALKAASFDFSLAGGILNYMMRSRKFPEKKGVWTTEDDNVLVSSKDVDSIMQLQKKHGVKECRKRLKFLKLLSDNK